MSQQRVYVVTGSNKGIGYAIVRALCKKIDGVVYLTARDATRMGEACEQLRKELTATEYTKLRSHTLDIVDAKSCTAFAQFLKKEHDGLDVLVNNAGIAYKNADTTPFPEQARVTNMTNYFGLRNICDALFPLLRSNGRVVNVQSQAGVMKEKGYSDEHVKLLKSPTLTIAQIDAFVNKFIERAAAGDHVAAGYRDSAYCVSKAAGIALSVVQQRAFDNDKMRSGILCCPGYVNTDMTSHKGPLTIDQGADTPVWLATLPTDATSPAGQFCFERTVIECEFAGRLHEQFLHGNLKNSLL